MTNALIAARTQRACIALLALLISTWCWSAAHAEDTPRAVPAPLPLEDAYDPNNPFAQMIRGERSQAKVYEDAYVLAFMDYAPVVPGHVLVISKVSRARNILDDSPEDLARLIAVVQRVGKAQVAGLGAQGFTVMQNNGAGQSVPHLHFHVIPRMSAAPLVLGPRAQVAPADLETVAAKLRAAMPPKP